MARMGSIGRDGVAGRLQSVAFVALEGLSSRRGRLVEVVEWAQALVNGRKEHMKHPQLVS